MTTQPRAELSADQVGDIVIEWFESDRRVGDAFIANGRENLSMADCVAIVQTALAADRAARGGELVAEAYLSWGGFNLSGDKASISEARRLVERCASLEEYLKVQSVPAPADRAARVAALVAVVTHFFNRDLTFQGGVVMADFDFHGDALAAVQDIRDALGRLAGEA